MSETNDKNLKINLNFLPEETTDSLLTPVAKSTGRIFKDIVEAIGHKTLGGIRRYNLVEDKNMQDFEEKLDSKTNEIPYGNRDKSKVGVALKALEDSKYQLNEEIMRDTFSTLFAKTLNSKTNQNISPIFSNILSNMSVDEAKLFKRITDDGRDNLPVAIIFQNKKETLPVVKQLGTYYLIFSDNTFLKNQDLAISHLQAHNLVEIIEHDFLFDETNDRLFNSFQDNVENFIEEFDKTDPEDCTIDVSKNYLRLTPLGKELSVILFE